MTESVFRVGASGHQHLGDEAVHTFVSQQLCESLTKYREEALQRGQQIVASSALALGADRLFVRTALELGIP